MADTEPTQRAKVPNAGEQLARQHELLMAAATKPARTTPQSVEYGERTTGDRSGHLAIKSVQLVQNPEESDVAFLGREEAFLRARIALRDKLNTEYDRRLVGAVEAEAD